jgi:allantoinase
MEPLLRLRSRRVVTPDGVIDAVVEVRGGTIEAVRPSEFGDLGEARDLGDAVLMPGLVDTHVHVNAPGREEWEGWRTASHAAAVGGVTTLIDMPLNSIPATTDAAALEAKRARAAAESIVDFGFWGGVVPGNAGALDAMAAAGVRGFKCFLVDSGVPEFPAAREDDLDLAMPVLARLGLPLLVHAEWPATLARHAEALARGDTRRHATWLASRPPEAEVDAIRAMIRLCERHACAVHVVHLVAAEALADLRAARHRGLPITVETCPHYLTFDAESIPDGATEFKCAPPIRGAANRAALIEALMGSDIDMVASDHSPCPPALKQAAAGDFAQAWGGIASLELGLPATWTALGAHGAGLGAIARWMCERPAALAGLGGRKGGIAAGYDADFVVWKPEETFEVRADRLHQRHPLTPYAGRRLAGVVHETWLKGTRIFERGAHGFGAGPPGGRPVAG